MENYKPKVLIIGDVQDAKILNKNITSDNWEIYWYIINYDNLYKHINDIRNNVNSHKIDFLLYTRNDQIAKKVNIGEITNNIKIGYSSISGIDERFWTNQMINCYNNFLSCNHLVDFKDLNTISGNVTYNDYNNNGDFSIVFDTEQLGCIYGLPRILNILDKYNIKATFFVTNIMKKIYPNIVNIISSKGHEIGLHGKWHEFLNNYNIDQQNANIKEQIEDFGVQIYGANFINRMNYDTINGLINNNVKYFVYPLINYYKFLNYPKLPTKSMDLYIENKSIKVIPINVETYNNSWFFIKNMIDSAYNCSISNNRHITILCHPFRDGNDQNIQVTDMMLKYLIFDKKLKPILLKDSKACDDSIEYNELLQLKFNKLSKIPTTKNDIISIVPGNISYIHKHINRHKKVWW